MSHGDRHTTITPAPVPRDKPATIGETLSAVDDHAAWCAEKRKAEREGLAQQSAEQHNALWRATTEMKLGVAKIEARLHSAAWVIALAVTLAGAAITGAVVLARYAIIGAVVTELDRRLPKRVEAALASPAAEYYVHVQAPPP